MRGRALLIYRLVASSLRRRPVEVVVTVVAIAAATTTLMVGLALRDVSAHPYQTTRALTAGPDIAAMPSSPSPASLAQLVALQHAPGVVGSVGPFPVSYPIMTTKGSRVLAIVEGRSQSRSAVDQPYVTQGSWVRPGGVVIERAFAHELSLTVGDRVVIGGHSMRVDGLAVTAAVPTYPHTTDVMSLDVGNGVWNQATGLVWATEATARSLATPSAPLNYIMELKLANPAAAPEFENHYFSNSLFVWSWQSVSQIEAQQTQPFQRGLLIASSLLDLLAIASLAVVVGGRLAERTRRVGLLKAVGATPRLVAGVFLLEYLILALVGAGVGLLAGYFAAPLVADPGAGLIGNVAQAPVSAANVGIVVVLAVVLAAVASWVPSVRAARLSTTAALADSARAPKRRPRLTAWAAHLPVPMLLGLRLDARRLRRTALGVLQRRSDDDHDRGRDVSSRSRKRPPKGRAGTIRHSVQSQHGRHGRDLVGRYRRARSAGHRERAGHHLGDVCGLSKASWGCEGARCDDRPTQSRGIRGSSYPCCSRCHRGYPTRASFRDSHQPWFAGHHSLCPVARWCLPRHDCGDLAALDPSSSIWGAANRPVGPAVRHRVAPGV